MAQQAAGFQWLVQHLGFSQYKLTHRSYIGTRNKTEVALDGAIEETYGPKYAPAEDSITAHLEFALKYDDLNLDLIQAVFSSMDKDELRSYILNNPSGRYSRRIGFLYEWLTGELLEAEFEVNGNYIDLLDSSKYITGTIQKNSRWRINDNLLGGVDFCPVIRRNASIIELLQMDFRKEVDNLKAEYPPEIFNRATQYLYRKETKSSYEIESEKPTPDRMNRFVNLLYEAGKEPADKVLEEQYLTVLQNAIVDPRYKQNGYRDFQNYIGQSNYRLEEIYHYICPQPAMVHPMMSGLALAEQKTRELSPVIRAAIVSFGFVFIHPFLDGNGRIHRFLIHDMLIRDGFVGKDVIIPVSAHMVNNLQAYDAVLEAYSKPLMKRIQFTKNDKGELVITNPEEVKAYFLYPDLTLQTAFLAQAIQETIRHDLSEELLFLDRYDEFKKELLQLIDMPDKRANEIIVFIHQNKGTFPNRRKKHFSEITEEEFQEIERIYQSVFS
ncbi:Fic family protein [Paenimyroides viscosum]|uniref:Fic family protein n=1 Tax=Paenimyroides viscosum TaxID=2488729 RepID=A0A3P1B347_9FLAO|nr:Fic family protein [Paenimyroides viscosum]RRA95580.1 Fic family protein [Paenimyroides viscosum]